MEEEVTDDTMIKFLDSITQQASERLWMLDLGNMDGDTDEDVNVEDIKHGILAGNESEALELEKDFTEMNKSQKSKPTCEYDKLYHRIFTSNRAGQTKYVQIR